MIAVYYSPESMTKQQYETVSRNMSAAAEAGKLAGQPPIHHSCFGEEPQLMVFEIWPSQQDFDATWELLSGEIKSAGINLNREPDVLPVVGLMQEAHAPFGI